MLKYLEVKKVYNYKNFDKISFDLGMIECFCEMVAAKVKTLALSPAINPEHIEIVKKAVVEIAKKYQIKYFIEDNMILNNIAPESYTKNKYVFFFYQNDHIINSYLKLKDQQQKALLAKSYNAELRSKLSIKLCQLLSYPNEKIEEIEGKNV